MMLEVGGLVLRIPNRKPWMELAKCAAKEEDPEYWFPDKDGWTAVAAKKVCADCPVLVQCRDEAMNDPGLQGIWGGLTHAERMERRTNRRVTA